MRLSLLAAALAAVIAALTFARPHSTPGPPMRDFEAYYAAGAAWNSGRDPYSQAIWKFERTLPGVSFSQYQALPFVAPPAVLPLLGAFAKLPFNAANALWRGLLVLSLAGIALLTLKLAGRKPTASAVVAIALAAIGFGPLTSALTLGQLALPAMVVASTAVLRPAAGFAAWIQPNIGAALISQPRTWIGALLFGAACAAVEGWNGLLHYAGLLHRHSLAEHFSVIQITPASIVYGFGAPPLAANAIGVLVALAALCSWVALLRRSADAVERFCSTCALLPLAMPFFHEHDLLVLFVPSLLYTLRSEQRFWPLAALGALFAGTDWLGLAQRPEATIQTLLLIAALGCALVALRERLDPRMLFVPACALALVAAAGAFAQAHPAPVWPDAMGALPRNVQALDISSAWRAEQLASGLFVKQPVWAALRLMSLLGCALTAAAIAFSSKSPVGSRNPSPAPAAGF